MFTRRIALLLLVVDWLLGRPEPVRFLRWEEIQPIVAGAAAGNEKLPDFADAKEGEAWLRQRDAEIRARIDRAVEDSISSVIIFGTSFTTLPSLAGAATAVNAAGSLNPQARARVDAFLQAMDKEDSERFRLTLDYLRRRRIPEDEVKAFLSGNLRRFGLDQAEHQRTRKIIDEAIPAEASLTADFAIEEALRNLKAKGAVPTHIRRIAVIGPGLDFGGQADGFDSLPLQTVQPFAVLETVLRLGLAQPPEVQVTAFDLNPWVLANGKNISAKTRSGRYVLQLGHPAVAPWNAGALAYWQHFGEVVGEPATAAQSPSGIELRAIAIKPQFASRVTVEELNIVTQTFEVTPATGFDLVVSTNVLGYYNSWEQALALKSIALMMSKGGILLSNSGPSAPKLVEYEPAGTESVAYNKDGSGDSITAYRRR
ncbi:MAG TPA: CheR family methyltransferase [Bryobacteraceae bacterium]|nr:CheR family methyltransferase [Bryobacteraceae bacterium]